LRQLTNINYAGFEVFTAMRIEVAVFWIVTPEQWRACYITLCTVSAGTEL